MIGRHPLLARGKWLIVLCTGTALSFLGIGGGGEAPGDAIAVTTQGVEPSPSNGPKDLIYSAGLVNFSSPLANISTKGIFGDTAAFDDDDDEEFLIYGPLGGFVDVRTVLAGTPVRVPAQKYVGIESAPLIDGLVFLGQNLTTGQAELKQMYIGNGLAPNITDYQLRPDFSLSSGAFIKSNERDEFVGGSWRQEQSSSTATACPTARSSITTSPPVRFPWTPRGTPRPGFSVLNRGSRGIVQFPPDGSAPKYIMTAFRGSSLTAGPNGNLFVGDYDLPIVHELNPSGQQVAQYPVRATFALTFLPWGPPTTPPRMILLGVKPPLTFGFSDLQPTQVTETDVTLGGNNRLTDFKIIPGGYPLEILVDEFDPVARKGIVLELSAVGPRPPDRDAVTHRHDYDSDDREITHH